MLEELVSCLADLMCLEDLVSLALAHLDPVTAGAARDDVDTVLALTGRPPHVRGRNVRLQREQISAELFKGLRMESVKLGRIAGLDSGREVRFHVAHGELPSKPSNDSVDAEWRMYHVGERKLRRSIALVKGRIYNQNNEAF
jgi:hypothetical protein